MKTEFTAGELVDVVIKGARVQAFNAGYTTLAPKAGAHITIETGSAGVEITRMAPKEWPPQPGDVWEDRNGKRWFAGATDEASTIWMHPAEVGVGGYDHDILAERGPLTLASRRGWSPEPAPTVTEDEPVRSVDGSRAAKVQGLRELADWLEANPEVPFADTGYLAINTWAWQVRPGGHYSTDDEADAEVLRKTAALIGVSHIEGKHGGPHGLVVKEFAGRVRYELCHVVKQAPTAPAEDLTPGVGEVAGPAEGVGPATAPNGETEHYHVGGAAGGPGENDAECACGVIFTGFDTHADAVAVLDRHIAAPGGVA